MFTRNVALIACVATAVPLLATVTSQAAPAVSSLTTANKLTFSGRVALPGLTLEAGTYVFESGPGGTNPDIVRVVSVNRQKLYYLGFTVPVTRPLAQAQPLTFGEAAGGEAPPIVAWYPIGTATGHEFVYR